MAGSSATLPPTLAQRVRYLREQRDMSPEVLAFTARLPLRTIEDIESGIETFLSPSVRSRLARALHVRPGTIKEVEKPPAEKDSLETPRLQYRSLGLMDTIEENPNGQYACPRCGAPLIVRQFERRDLKDNVFTVIKAHCSQCLYRLTND